MERMTYQDEAGRAKLTRFGKHMYCSSQAIADCVCKLEEALERLAVPRVMPLEEVEALPDGSVVWLEDCDKADVIAGIVMDELITTRESGSVVVLIYFVVVRDKIIDRVTASAAGYKIRWRCWTGEPSKEHRKAVKLE